MIVFTGLSGMTHTRPLENSDWDDWKRLWTGYLTFYETTVPEDVYTTTFSRLLGDDPRDYSCIVAEKDGKMIGLTHYMFHRHAWKIEEVCYLQDLYVDPDLRGTGAGRALIEAVYKAADTKGAPSVYWMTQEFNETGRKLYDRIGTLTPFIKYARP